MFKKSLLAMLISASFTSSVIYAAEEVATSSEEVMVVSGEYLNYKSDSNKGSMRMEMTQLETPGQVNVIDSQIIEEQRASTLGEVLKNDSSVSAEGNSRNRERFSLRGFQLSSSTGYLRDGKQHWSHYRQPVELLESVEVLKGPSSLLYGQSAPGGLINMVTKKPTAATHFTLTQDVGSDNEMKSTLDVSGALNEDKTLRSRLILSKQSYDSWRSYSDGSSPSTDRFVGGLVVDYDVNDAITVSAHYDRTRDDGGVDTGAYVINDVSVISDNYIWDTQWSNIDNDVQNIGFDVDVRLNDNWSLNTSYNYQDFERHDVESYADETSYDETTGTYDQNGSDRRDNWVFQTASVDLMGQFNTGSIEHQVLIGTNWLGYRYDRLQYTLNTSTTTFGVPNASASIDETGRVTDTNSTYDAYGFYVQDMMTLNEQWQVLAGLRYDIKVTP
ncbi:MAG: TonB-dependent siderophore receptor, partial [Psychromonas sp.]